VTATPPPTTDATTETTIETTGSVVARLSDGVVTLRAHSPADAEAIVEQSADPDSLRWTTVPRPYSRTHAMTFIEGNLRAWGEPAATRSWAIEWTDPAGTARFAGTIDLRPGAAASVGELGFGLHPDARGHGVMSRAVRLILSHAFEKPVWGVPVTRVHWRAVVGNWGSRRAAWSTGFTFHGTIPASHPDPAGGTEALDTWHASITPDDSFQPRNRWLAPVPLEGDRVRLREWRGEDVEAIEPRDDDPVHWMPARSVLRRETFTTAMLTRLERMADGTALDWCVADRETDRALGNVTLFSRGGPITDAAELGYQFFPSARGRGAAKEAARLAVGHAFTPVSAGGLGVRRLVAETAADNEASNAVLRSAGFVTFGREHAVDLLEGGGWGDGLYWELLPADPEAGPR
jgi:RimJ/RimL family protein N-acetyltransferase